MKIERFPGDCAGYVYEAKFGTPGYIGDNDVPNGILWESPAIEEFAVYIDNGKERLDITETLNDKFLERAMEYVQEEYDRHFDGHLGIPNYKMER